MGGFIQLGATNAWGKPQTKTTEAPFGFMGEIQDNFTGLVNLRARWYHPETGRFLSRDPISGWAGMPASQHPYQYAYNDPLTYTDPSGMTKFLLGRDSGQAGKGPTKPYGLGSYNFGSLGASATSSQRRFWNGFGNHGLKSLTEGFNPMNGPMGWHIKASDILAPELVSFLDDPTAYSINAVGRVQKVQQGLSDTANLMSLGFASWKTDPWNNTIKTLREVEPETWGAIAAEITLMAATLGFGSGSTAARTATQLERNLMVQAERQIATRSTGFFGRFGDDVVAAGRKALAECSFSAATSVTLANGNKPISEVAIGEQVLAYNETTDTTGIYTVTNVLVHTDPVMVYLTIDGEQIETTPTHRFYVVDQGWVEAHHLRFGDQIRDAEGDGGMVTKVEIDQRPQPMYDLTVATAHTFFVGEGRWLVHNCNKVPRLSQVKALRDMGVDKAGRRAFFEGESAPFMLPTRAGDPTFGTLKLTGTRLQSGIVVMKDLSGGALREFAHFRTQANKVAKSFGATELEIYGGAITNTKIEAMVQRLGFTLKTATVPQAWGDATIEIYSKVFPVR